MATPARCPSCGTPMREIVWGYGTIADVEDAGDVVIGGCVIDVDDDGRVAALQCPVCDTRADAEGVALEAPRVPATTEHPFAVSFSSPTRARSEVTMTDPSEMRPDAQSSHAPPEVAEASPFVDEDFGGAGGGDRWRDRIEPYSSRDSALPPPSAPAPDHVEPYASREDALPAGGPMIPDHVEPYSSRDDRLPQATGAWRERVEPYGAAPADDAPHGTGAAAAAASDVAQADPASAGIPPVDDGADAVPGAAIDARWSFTSDFADAEEEGWPPGSRDDD